jgi:PEP-CTERM motif
MNRLVSGLAAAAFAAGLYWTAGAARATVYTGPGTGDGTVANDGGAISSVDVSNDNNNISFTINSTQNMQSYIFFTVELQITGQAANGSTSLTNPFTPNIGISTGVNSEINTYGSGASTFTYSGGWNQTGFGSYAAGGTGSTFATITEPLSSLGLSVGNSFLFDVVSSYTNPEHQSAYSALDSTGYPAETDNSYKPYLGTNAYDSATDASSTFNTGASLYVVTAVPEPATIGLVALSGLGLMARRNKKS